MASWSSILVIEDMSVGSQLPSKHSGTLLTLVGSHYHNYTLLSINAIEVVGMAMTRVIVFVVDESLM